MKWLPGDSRWWQYAAEDQRYTVVKWQDAGKPDRYCAMYKPSDLAPVQDLSGFTTDINVARRAAERHYAATQRKAA